MAPDTAVPGSATAFPTKPIAPATHPARLADDCAGKSGYALAHQIVRRQRLGYRQRGRSRRRGIAFQVVDVRKHLDASDTIGDGVTQMQQLGRASVGEPFDEGRTPEWTRDVQRGLLYHLGQIEYLSQRAGLGDPHPPDVEIEVEVRVDHPSGRGGRQGRHDDLLPQPRNSARRVVEVGAVTLPVGGGVENFQRHDAGARPRICLAAMQQLIECPQLVTFPPGVGFARH